jgi:hypothetical protein
LGLIGECTFTTSIPSATTARTRSGQGTSATGTGSTPPRAAVTTASGRLPSRATGSGAITASNPASASRSSHGSAVTCVTS